MPNHRKTFALCGTVGIFLVVVATLAWHEFRPVRPVYRVYGADLDDMEIDADPGIAARQSKPKPDLSVKILRYDHLDDQSVDLKFRIRNLGKPSSVKDWRITITKNGKSYEAHVLRSFPATVVNDSPVTGHLLFTMPKPVFITKTDFLAIKLDVGYEDDLRRWRWTRYHP